MESIEMLLSFFELFLAIRNVWPQRMTLKADLQDYTRNLEAMYNSLRSFKHDYINILLSMTGHIRNGDMDELRQFFETKIFPTKNLIDQGDYKLKNIKEVDTKNRIIHFTNGETCLMSTRMMKEL